MALTPEQRAVVTAGDVDLAVTAGAGSGKTHVLVERYVALLERCGIPEIAAVTFTEAAASEMRERVRREVLTRDDLSHHRAGVDDAVIGTIHAFCLRLLREHPIEAALDPAIEVLAEDEAELLRRSASAAAIDDAAAVGDNRVEALRVIGVFQLNQLLSSLVAERDDVASAFAAMGDDASMAPRLRALLDARCAELIEPLRDRVCDELDEILALAKSSSDRLVSAIEAVAAACSDARRQAWETWYETVPTLLQDGIDLRRGSRDAWVIPKPDVTKLVNGVRSRIETSIRDLPRWTEHDDAAMAATPALRALFEDACHRYEAAKAERGGLDFLDLELHAVRLLEADAVRAATRQRFRHLMVDEAQDVSPLQARLIRLLTDGPGEGPRLLLVGDEKQSIYGFRGADVRQFRELRALVASRDGIEADLSQSFRTHERLVQHTNELFASVFAGGAAAMTPMTGRPGDPPEGPHLVVMPVRKERGDDNRGRRLAEATLVAEEIERLVASGRPVWDRAARGYRPVARRDVAILLRRYTNVHLYEQALEARAIDYATPSGTGFFGRQEVLDLENLLRWLAEPDDEIALVGILRSPLFLIADDVLFALGQAPRPLLRALRAPPPAVDQDDRARCTFAAGVLDGLREQARTAMPVDLLEAALQATGFEASWAPLAGGEQTLANIRKLVRIVRSLGGFALSEVAEYLRQRREELDAREGPAVLDRPDAVQIMTVHGAKGLEFPVVFVPEAHIAARDTVPAILWRPSEGISFTLDPDEDGDGRSRPGFYRHLHAQTWSDDREEHRRLFYVAATRARDYLTLSGDADQNDGWLRAAQDVVAAGGLDGAEFRAPVPAREVEVRRRAVPSVVRVPERQEPYVPPLLARPPVIPLRSSTPVTALRFEVPRRAPAVPGDGLGLVRGRIAHRAIEARFGHGPRLEVSAIAAQEAAEASREVRASLIVAVEAMLARFETSDIARELLAPEAAPRFEAPFAWDWDGIPVHGQIDLLYRAPGGWRVVDFKTDRVTSTDVAAVARPYLVQLGLYARAIEAATGARPAAGLLFLRDGRWYEPPRDEVESALVEARARIDGGPMLDPELAEYLGRDDE